MANLRTPNVVQLLQRFNAQLANSRTVNAAQRAQIAQLSEQYVQLVNAVGWQYANTSALAAQLKQQLSVLPTFTPNQGMNPDTGLPLAPVQPGTGMSGFESYSGEGEPAIFDEDFD